MNRVVSLIASSTETICALGYEESLCGRSHECDYPESVLSLPICSEPKFDIEGTSKEIDDRVRDTLKNALSVYKTHVDVLEELEPTLIVTQDHCEVCAVSLADVEAAVCDTLKSNPKIVSLAPNTLKSIFAGMVEIADALGNPKKGERLVEALKERMKHVSLKTAECPGPKPKVACIEWVEPLMVAGNWMPELVELAGGINVLGPTDSHSSRITIDELAAVDPDLIIVMPCGWGIDKGREELKPFLQNKEWKELRAVSKGKLFYADGNSYFNRPGPRLADSAEMLAEMMYPDLFDFGYKGLAWEGG